MKKPIIGITTNLETGDEKQPIRLNRRHLYLDLDYAYAIREAGGIPIAIGSLEGEDAAALLDRIDALLIPGGGDLAPETVGEAGTSGRISSAARTRTKRAECRGTQLGKNVHRTAPGA